MAVLFCLILVVYLCNVGRRGRERFLPGGRVFRRLVVKVWDVGGNERKT